jgi:acyl-CoA synthetase (AMP-forming)/AMP-acid ligase II
MIHVLCFISGTTGNPKGALHAHRTLLGHLPGIEFPQEFFPQPNDVFWTPADWFDCTPSLIPIDITHPTNQLNFLIGLGLVD